MRHRIITLLTDFGTKDHYVASMKGVILGIHPGCTLVDISHEIGPQDIEEGAFVLAGAFSSFPRGTIHLSVVDPGVGGPRNPILIVTSNYYFIGPDNGLFTLSLLREKVKKAFVLTNKKYFLSSVSSTFHGRDLFAPVAAYLSLGLRPEAFGERTRTWVQLSVRKPEQKAKEFLGEILHSDVFGNLTTNIEEESLSGFTRGRPFGVQVGRHRLRGLKKGYWKGDRGEVIALVGSGGFLEISVRDGNARERLKVKRGAPVRITIENGN